MVQSNATDVASYIEEAAAQRREALRKLRSLCVACLPGYEETMKWGMAGYLRNGAAEVAFAMVQNRAELAGLDLIILDEPTTALSLTETEKVFRFVRAVKAAGRSILFIGHNIHHVFGIADRFIVLDRGRVVLEAAKSDVASAEMLISFMEKVAESPEIGRRPISQENLEMRT